MVHVNIITIAVMVSEKKNNKLYSYFLIAHRIKTYGENKPIIFAEDMPLCY
jgi:predicted peroxiredoxin